MQYYENSHSKIEFLYLCVICAVDLLCVYFVDGSLWAVHTNWLGFGFRFWRNGEKSR